MMRRRTVPRWVLAAGLSLASAAPTPAPGQPAAASPPPARPNILWLSAEDISPHLGCYGDPQAVTPHLDRLAAQGVRFTHAFTTAGVCAPCRSGIITGLYQTTLGTHHMRCRAELPEAVRPFPALLREAGYYGSNNSKQDYQFKAPEGTWDESSGRAHWRRRKDPAQPFFAVFNFNGCHESGIAGAGKYRSVTKVLTPDQRRDPAALELPPYYPDTPVVREDWKRNYELITAMDHWAGGLLKQLEEDGLAEDTVVFFWSDHGVGLPRAKRWLYDSGTRIPLIVRIPEKLRRGLPGQAEPGSVSDRLVSSIDLGPTVLRLAGVEPPAHAQGRPFLGAGRPAPRDYVFGARDRMDERYDIIRMVRDRRFKYIRNYEPLKSAYQYINTAENGATMRELRRLHDAGQLGPVAGRYFGPTKPAEELYDCVADPHEVHNLAAEPRHRETLGRMRAAHLAWVRETKDLGLLPEAILARRENAAGSRYAILRQPGGDNLYDRLAATAAAASAGPGALPDLLRALGDPDEAVRYWGATGVGNIGTPAAAPATPAVEAALEDGSPAVQIAAARALCRLGQPARALPVLTRHLLQGAQWERLQAAVVLDEIDGQARPAIPQMKEALAYQPSFLAEGKYRVRVINRALNELLGTDRQVK